jgi:catechol 2,3-dioxygenase-like lactoylglutathione lyase family enzyme
MRLNRIHQIALYARDLEEAIAFYRDTLGASYLGKFDPPGLAFFYFVGVRLLLEQAGPQSTIYFWVEDIDAAYAELRSKGIEFTTEPQLVHRDDAGTFGKPGNEEWMAFFRDPSDNVLALVTQR